MSRKMTMSSTSLWINAIRSQEITWTTTLTSSILTTWQKKRRLTWATRRHLPYPGLTISTKTPPAKTPSIAQSSRSKTYLKTIKASIKSTNLLTGPTSKSSMTCKTDSLTKICSKASSVGLWLQLTSRLSTNLTIAILITEKIVLAWK